MLTQRYIACGNCSKKSTLRGKCIFSQSGGPTGPRRSFDVQESILDRDGRRDHEQLQRRSSSCASGQQFTSGVHSSRSNVYPSHSGELPPPFSTSNPSPAGKSTGEHSGGTRPAVNNISPSVIDSMTAVVDEGTSTREYFGTSSAGSFTKQIKRAIEAKLGNNRGSDSESASRRAQMVPTTSTRAIVNDLSLIHI